MKQEFKRIPVTFHLDRLQSEFDKSHANIPGKNKKMWLKLIQNNYFTSVAFVKLIFSRWGLPLINFRLLVSVISLRLWQALVEYSADSFSLITYRHSGSTHLFASAVNVLMRTSWLAWWWPRVFGFKSHFLMNLLYLYHSIRCLRTSF